MLVSVHTDHFLSNILISLNILTEGRNGKCHQIAVNDRIKSKILHNLKNFLVRHHNAKTLVHLVNADTNFSGLHTVSCIDIHMRA